MIQVTKVHYAQRRTPPFEIDRKRGYPEYSFAHFTNGIQTVIRGKTVRLPPNTCILWRPDTPQYFTNNEETIHDWFHFTIENEAVLRELDLPLDQWIYPGKWHFISDIIEELQEEFYSEQPQKMKLMNLKVLELFIKLARAQKNAPDESTAEQLRQLRSKMLGSLNHPWSVAELAYRLSLSPSRFHALYRAQYGTSPIDDLVRARIEAAKYEITATHRTMGEIAEDLGYRNLTHFSRQFKTHTGVSPTQYEKEKRQQ